MVKNAVVAVLAAVAIVILFSGATTPEHVDISKTAALEKAIQQRDSLLQAIAGKKVDFNNITSIPVTVSWYSLSVEECDSDVLTAAYGPSVPNMVSPSARIINELGLKPRDKVLITTDDGQYTIIAIYLDRLNKRYDNSMRVDVVAPHRDIALKLGVRPGRITKL